MAWSQGTQAQFSQTRWSVVLTARDLTAPDGRHALEQLCQSYRPPVYAFIRRRGLGPHDAEDFTQGFFAYLLAQPFLQNVAPANGRFRSFLLAALERFLINEWNHARALKRGGGVPPVSLDSPEADAVAVAASDGARAFERAWALAIVRRAFDQLSLECQEAGKAAMFEELQSHLLQGEEPAEAPSIAARLGLGADAVRQARSRLRRRFRELLGATIAETVRDPAEIEAETRYLISVCANEGRG